MAPSPIFFVPYRRTPIPQGIKGNGLVAARDDDYRSRGLLRLLGFGVISVQCRIACRLLLGHIWTCELHGNPKSASLVGDQTPGESHR